MNNVKNSINNYAYKKIQNWKVWIENFGKLFFKNESDTYSIINSIIDKTNNINIIMCMKI